LIVNFIEKSGMRGGDEYLQQNNKIAYNHTEAALLEGGVVVAS
jgi:hypothetical protein